MTAGVSRFDFPVYIPAFNQLFFWLCSKLDAARAHGLARLTFQLANLGTLQPTL
jgi:hypothetical protein